MVVLWNRVCAVWHRVGKAVGVPEGELIEYGRFALLECRYSSTGIAIALAAGPVEILKVAQGSEFCVRRIR